MTADDTVTQHFFQKSAKMLYVSNKIIRNSIDGGIISGQIQDDEIVESDRKGNLLFDISRQIVYQPGPSRLPYPTAAARLAVGCVAKTVSARRRP